MKTKILNVFALVLMLSLILTSCKKDDDNTTPANTNTTTSQFSATINNNTWNSSHVSTTFATTSQGEAFNIVANSNNNGSMILSIVGKQVKTYLLDESQNKLECGLTFNDKNGLFWPNLRGQVVLTKVDDVNLKISGTFNFVVIHGSSGGVIDTMKINNGKFTDLAYSIFAK